MPRNYVWAATFVAKWIGADAIIFAPTEEVAEIKLCQHLEEKRPDLRQEIAKNPRSLKIVKLDPRIVVHVLNDGDY